MVLKPHKALLLTMAIGAGLAPLTAEAGLLGSDLSWQYYAGGGPLAASIDGAVTGGTFTDDGGVGGTFVEPFDDSAIPIFNIDATGATITFDYSAYTASDSSEWSTSPLSLAPTIYNGIAIGLGSPGSFLSVTVDPATNMTGFSSSDVSFTSSQIEVDWQGLTFTPTTIVQLDVTTDSAPAAPEPAAMGMMLLAVLPGILLFRRKSGAR